VRLLLERTLRLDGQLGGHFCENTVRQGNKVELSGRFVAKGCRIVRCRRRLLRKTKFRIADIQCGSCAVAALVLFRNLCGSARAVM
jgi:hypothetical protein